jgi:hypothetical protein
MDGSVDETGNKIVGWIKKMFGLLYNKYVRIILLGGLIGCALVSFVGYTMLVAQVDSAKAQTVQAETRKVLVADATVTGQVFLLFAIGAMVLSLLTAGADLLVYVTAIFTGGKGLSDYQLHKDVRKDQNAKIDN